MGEYNTVYRILNLISQLNSPMGCRKSVFSEDHFVNVRTFERYIDALRNIGFEIVSEKGRFKMAGKGRSNVDHTNLIVFSPEEAGVIRDALINSGIQSPIKRNILVKLYALTDLFEISDSLTRSVVSKNINEIRRAIKDNKQVILKGYLSLNSDTQRDRLVEPIRFIHYFRYLAAFDVENKEVKHFKTDRFERAEILKEGWQFQDRHKLKETDLFGMKGSRKTEVELLLSTRAAQLLKEEFPGIEQDIIPNGDQWKLHTHVFALEGIGRFVMGLVDEIEILKPAELSAHLAKKINKFHQRHHLSEG